MDASTRLLLDRSCFRRRCPTSAIVYCKSSFGIVVVTSHTSELRTDECFSYHPFLLKKKLKNLQGQIPNSFLSRSFEIAYDHAKQLVLQIDAAKVAGCHAHVSFNSYAAVVAGSILTLCPHNASDALLAEANSVQQTNIAYLAELGGWWNHTPTAVSRR